jgi:hypothetical protein
VAGASSTALRGLGIGAGSLASQADAIALGTSSTASGGTNSVAIGLGATSSLASAIILGNSATTAVRVGIGTTDSIGVPSAKIHVVGVSGTPVLLMNQVATGITSAPQLLNPSTSAGAETPIHYDGSNELFGFTSSARYKENIRPIQRESDILYALRPVIYDAKEGHGVGTNIAGFIAEEVHEVAPHLAVLNRDRQPENIAYNSLHALAIKEIQKHDLMLQERAALVAAQDRAMHALLLSIEQLQAKLDALAFDEVQA